MLQFTIREQTKTTLYFRTLGHNCMRQAFLPVLPDLYMISQLSLHNTPSIFYFVLLFCLFQCFIVRSRFPGLKGSVWISFFSQRETLHAPPSNPVPRPPVCMQPHWPAHWTGGMPAWQHWSTCCFSLCYWAVDENSASYSTRPSGDMFILSWKLSS